MDLRHKSSLSVRWIACLIEIWCNVVGTGSVYTRVLRVQLQLNSGSVIGMNIFFQGCNQRIFGTANLAGDVATRAVRTAVEIGYRSIDTAQMYENEAEVGCALAECGIDREKLCITTKVLMQNYQADRFMPSVEESLRRLKTEYVDVLLLHWPPSDQELSAPLELLQKARELGYSRNIGVSNFTSAMMKEASALVGGNLVVNQVEFHPLLDQSILLKTAAETGIPLSAYCSIARGKILEFSLFDELAAAYDKTPVQVGLRWIIQKGVAPLTMSSKVRNMRLNFDIMDFTLSSVDMARIDALNLAGYRICDKELVPWAPDFD